MKLGILSDTHNNIANTRRALALFREHGVERLVHCGDLIRPVMIEEFIGWPVSFVYGNCDHERDEQKRNVHAMLQDSTIGEQWTLEIDGVCLFAMHGDDSRRLNAMITSRTHDIVFRGHSHERLDARIGSTRVINPGSLGGKKPQSRSICVLDLPTGEAKFIELPD
jgi:putative phosphoesterase